MSVTLHNPDGTPNAGDPAISAVMKDYATDIGGYITDNETGDVLFDARRS